MHCHRPHLPSETFGVIVQLVDWGLKTRESHRLQIFVLKRLKASALKPASKALTNIAPHRGAMEVTAPWGLRDHGPIPYDAPLTASRARAHGTNAEAPLIVQLALPALVMKNLTAHGWRAKSA